MTETERLRAVFDYLRENKIVRNQQDFVERIGSDKSTVSQCKDKSPNLIALDLALGKETLKSWVLVWL